MEVYLTEDDEYDLETVVRTHLGGGLYFDVEDAEVVDEH